MPISRSQVPKEKILVAFERALCNVVNDVGVVINDTVGEVYQQNVLPFVSGLGPRKAQKLITDIVAMVRYPSSPAIERLQLVAHA